MFSNRVLRLTIEVQAAKFDALIEGTERAGVSLAAEPLTDVLRAVRAMDADNTLVGTSVPRTALSHSLPLPPRRTDDPVL